MYLDIHTLEIADGLKDALIHLDFTIESILKREPSEIALIMGIDPYVAEIIFNAAKKAAKSDDLVPQRQEDNNHHILESKSNMHRLLYCPLCQKLISKIQCQKLTQDKHGNLYKVNTYHYDKLSKLERTKRKEQNEGKRQQELSNIELNRIVHHVFNNM